jgi:hypothetical protein
MEECGGRRAAVAGAGGGGGSAGGGSAGGGSAGGGSAGGGTHPPPAGEGSHRPCAQLGRESEVFEEGGGALVGRLGLDHLERVLHLYEVVTQEQDGEREVGGAGGTRGGVVRSPGERAGGIGSVRVRCVSWRGLWMGPGGTKRGTRGGVVRPPIARGRTSTRRVAAAASAASSLVSAACSASSRRRSMSACTTYWIGVHSELCGGEMAQEHGTRAWHTRGWHESAQALHTHGTRAHKVTHASSWTWDFSCGFEFGWGSCDAPPRPAAPPGRHSAP